MVSWICDCAGLACCCDGYGHGCTVALSLQQYSGVLYRRVCLCAEYQLCWTNSSLAVLRPWFHVSWSFM